MNSAIFNTTRTSIPTISDSSYFSNLEINENSLPFEGLSVGRNLPLQGIPLGSQTGSLFGETPFEFGSFLIQREKLPLQVNGYLPADLTEELKRISYFELMKTPPSMHQLFNHDFKVLVENMISVQKENNLLQVSISQPATLGTSLQDGLISSDMLLAKNIQTSTDVASVINTNTQEVSYNHLLYSHKQNNTTETHQRYQNQTSRRPQPSQEEKPYFERKNKSSKNKNSQKMLKKIISGLQTLNKTLSKYVE